jgi:hypothetical protein
MARPTPQPEDESRARVEAVYGGPIPDVTWEWLVRKRYIAELTDGSSSVDDIVSTVRELNAVAPNAVTRLVRRVGSADAEPVLDGINNRMQAVAQIVALRASRSSRVGSWRRRWLPDGLIAVDDVTSWIDQTYRHHLPKLWPADRGPRDATSFAGALALWPHRYVKLQWLDVAQRSGRVWCVPPRGPLADLAAVVDRLVDDWDWHPALATNFVLTDETPARPGVRGLSYRTRRGFDDRYGSYDYMWIRASIDIEVTPEELAAWWRSVRSDLGIAGRKPIGEKSVRLALFAISRDVDTTYREDMDAWNAEVPAEWRFTDWRNFRTAGHKAMEALNRPAAECTAN